MDTLDRLAPCGEEAVDYDRRHLALYAALLDAADAHTSWQEAATSLMKLDLNESDAEACWRSHLERARWIIGDGLANALATFNERRVAIKAV